MRNLAAQKEQQQQHTITTSVASPVDNNTSANSITSTNDLLTATPQNSSDSATTTSKTNPVALSTDIALDISCSTTDSMVYEKLRLLNGHAVHHNHQHLQSHHQSRPTHHHAWPPRHYSSSSWYTPPLNTNSNLTATNPSNTSASTEAPAFHSQHLSPSSTYIHNNTCSANTDDITLKKGVYSCLYLFPATNIPSLPGKIWKATKYGFFHEYKNFSFCYNCNIFFTQLSFERILKSFRKPSSYCKFPEKPKT